MRTDFISVLKTSLICGKEVTALYNHFSSITFSGVQKEHLYIITANEEDDTKCVINGCKPQVLRTGS